MSETFSTDPAAVFSCAVSLRDAACARAAVSGLSLSDVFSGMDGFQRELMRVATLFEIWAVTHVAFDHLTEVWPYLLEDHFGDACMAVATLETMSRWDEMDCLRISEHLGLTLYDQDGQQLPLMIRAANPVADSAH